MEQKLKMCLKSKKMCLKPNKNKKCVQNRTKIEHT